MGVKRVVVVNLEVMREGLIYESISMKSSMLSLLLLIFVQKITLARLNAWTQYNN
jgi:hypothetical protein